MQPQVNGPGAIDLVWLQRCWAENDGALLMRAEFFSFLINKLQFNRADVYYI